MASLLNAFRGLGPGGGSSASEPNAEKGSDKGSVGVDSKSIEEVNVDELGHGELNFEEGAPYAILVSHLQHVDRKLQIRLEEWVAISACSAVRSLCECSGQYLSPITLGSNVPSRLLALVALSGLASSPHLPQSSARWVL